MYGHPFTEAPEKPFYQGSDPLIEESEALNRKGRFERMITFFRVFGKINSYWGKHGETPDWTELDQAKQSLVDFLKGQGMLSAVHVTAWVTMLNDLVELRKLDWSYHNSAFSQQKKDQLFAKYNEVRRGSLAEDLGIYMQIQETDSMIAKFSLAEIFNELREYNGETQKEFERKIMSWPPVPYTTEFQED